jgi:signal transduction histidine kinase/ligand-binding sensor domain-containing protein
MFRLRSPALAACALAFLAGSRLLAQAEPSGLEAIPRSDDTILRSWVAQDGLPDVEIAGITQTPDGYLWLATLNSLVRFDGERFTRIPESSGLKPDRTSAVLTARDGTLWTALVRGGLARMQAGRFQVVVPPPANGNRAMTSLAEDAEGGIWSSLPQGGDVLRWKAGKTDRFHLGDGEEPIVLCAATNGVIWFTSYKRCGFFNGREFQLQPLGDNACGQIAAARRGGAWTIAGQKLLRLQENGKSEVVADMSWLGDATQVAALYEDREGNLWIGTLGAGLFRFHDGAFERVPTSFPLINCLYEDRNGNLWAGTRGGGLDRLSRRQIFMHAAPTDRSPNPVGPRDILVGAVIQDNKGLVWMAQGKSLVRATDATNRTFALAPGWKGPNGVFAMRSTPTGEIWLGGGSPKALRCWKDGRFLTQIPLHGDLAAFLLGDKPHQIWATIKPHPGVYESYGKTFTLLPESAGIANPVALARDPQKRLWVGTMDGRVYYRKGAGFVEAPMPDPQPGDLVTFLVPDGKDTVWIGCVASGLYRWHAGRIDKLPSDAGLPLREPSVLEIDPQGNFWLGTLLGLYRVSRAELDAVLDGRQPTLQAVAYGPRNGMPAATAFHYGFLHSSMRTPDNHLWFGTTFGGMEVVPEKASDSTASPAVLVEDLLVRGKSVLPSPAVPTPLSLPPQPGPIQIRYTLPELGTPEQVRFRYRLLGLNDDSWSSSDPQRIATFTNLPPGNYTFEVAATNPLASTQPKAASLSFSVSAAWWETLWFRFISALAAALAIAALVSLAVRRRMRARIRRLEQEHALERERARIARDMHDELGARITQIMLINEAARQQPQPDFDQISEAIQSVSSTLDQIVWTTNPRNDTLEGLVDYVVEFAEEYLAPAGIELLLELPADIPDRSVSSDRRHQMLLVVKEALNNIVKHARASQVRLRIALQENELQIVLTDNGAGFQFEDVSHTSNGLANMRHRMESIGGKARIETQPGNGTTITLTARI